MSRGVGTKTTFHFSAVAVGRPNQGRKRRFIVSITNPNVGFGGVSQDSLGRRVFTAQRLDALQVMKPAVVSAVTAVAVTPMTVTVPPGVAAGTELMVVTPSGQSMRVTVPNGLTEGAQFQVLAAGAALTPPPTRTTTVRQRACLRVSTGKA